MSQNASSTSLMSQRSSITNQSSLDDIVTEVSMICDDLDSIQISVPQKLITPSQHYFTE